MPNGARMSIGLAVIVDLTAICANDMFTVT